MTGLFSKTEKQNNPEKDIETGEGYKSIVFEGKEIRVLIIEGNGDAYGELDEHVVNGFTLFSPAWGVITGNSMNYSSNIILRKPKVLKH